MVLLLAIDTYIASIKPKRGAVPVDEAFLKDIESWRDILAKNIAAWNKQLDQRTLNTAVQLTLDRLIFLRICEDRDIEEYERLLRIAQGGNIYKRLVNLFQEADERYNSGLFHFINEPKRTTPHDDWTPTLHIDDEPLHKIINRLYYPNSPYAFSVIPVEILGQVYEQFLGKVIHLDTTTDARKVIIEDKPAVKKAGGVFYTPSYIVEHIVQNTLGPLVEGKKPADLVPPPTSKSKQNSATHAAPWLTILDPACGSGSFLLGAYQFLLDWYHHWYTSNEPATHSQAVYQSSNGDWRLTPQERKRILLDHIYGVDIDAQAVEVTKLSLMLKVLEGQTQETIQTQLSMFKERALPDLDKNIKCGNSLISPDFYATAFAQNLDTEAMYRINAFDWHTEFALIMKGGGFSAIIGNPPYGAIFSDEEIAYISNTFSYQDYQIESYTLFLEKSINILRKKGYIGFIIPNTWLINVFSKRLRKHLLSSLSIREIRHFLYKVFKNVSIDTEIVVFLNDDKNRENNIKIALQSKYDEKIFYIPQRQWIDKNGHPINIMDRPEISSFKMKIEHMVVLDQLSIITQGCKPFQVGKGKPPQTRDIVDNKPYVATFKKDDSFIPLLRGSLIQRYQTLWSNDYWISFGDWLAEPRYSAHYNADKKIVIRQTGDSLVATLDKEQFVVRDNLYTITSREISQHKIEYILGLINSNLLSWIYQNFINPEKDEALAQVKRSHIAKIPIRTINFEDPTEVKLHDQVVALVETMLDLHKQRANVIIPQEKATLDRRIEATDNQIDQLVYQLYNLSAEEIAIIEQYS